MARKPLVTPEPDESFMDAAPPPEQNERMEALQNVAKDFSMWRPAREVLTSVRAIRTIFPQFDRATRVNGYPIERINVVHGPSGNGKTTFMMGLGLSFLMGGHYYLHMDAEMTTPIDWPAKYMGKHVDLPTFMAIRPRSYEQAIDATKQACEMIGEAKARGRIPDDTTALIGVDSIRKLMPQHLLDKIKKEGADGLGGRAGQLKAAMNQAWFDELTPLLNHTGTSVLVIARESVDPKASVDDQKYDTAWKVGGGEGIIYDASLVIRIRRASWVYESSGKKSGGEKAEKGKAIGERLRVRVWKSKVESKDDKHAECYFHTSNGTLYPEGFDTARDVLELGVKYGLVERAGAWYSYNDERLGQGETKAVITLRDNPELLAHVENAVRAEFSPDDDLSTDADDEEES